MKSVIFGFARPIKYNILSAAIQNAEKRPFSHAYVRFKEPISQKDVVFQASGIAINLCLFEVFCIKELPVEEYELPLTDAEFLELWNYVLSKLGTPYSAFQLIAILVNKIFHIEIMNNGTSAEICSELAAHTSAILGFKPPGDLDYQTPSDFNRFCKECMQRIL